MSMAERIDQMTVVDPNTAFRKSINSKGEVYYAKPPMDSTDTRMMISIFELAAKAATGKDEVGNPVFKKDVYDQVVRDMTAQYRYQQATRMPANTPAQAQARRRAMEEAMGELGTPSRAKPKFSVPQTGPDYVKQNMGGGNPLQQMLQQQQEQPQPQSQPMQTPEEIQQLQKKIEDDAAEQPKKEEPKRQTTSVTFNGISDINGLKAWVNGKRLAVGDEMPNGGKITDLDFDNGTLTYELDGKKYTIRKSRNAQNI